MRKLIALALLPCLLGCSEDSNTLTNPDDSLGPHVATVVRGLELPANDSYERSPIGTNPETDVWDFEEGHWLDQYCDDELYEVRACVHFRSLQSGEWQQFQCKRGHATGGSLNAGVDQIGGTMSICGLPGHLVRFTIDVYEN